MEIFGAELQKTVRSAKTKKHAETETEQQQQQNNNNDRLARQILGRLTGGKKKFEQGVQMSEFSPRTPEEVFQNFKGRQAGINKALNDDVVRARASEARSFFFPSLFFQICA
jgi:hypothetical protein